MYENDVNPLVLVYNLINRGNHKCVAQGHFLTSGICRLEQVARGGVGGGGGGYSHK